MPQIKIHDIRDYLQITLGLVLYAVGLCGFILPYEITTGGLSGAGAVIFYATGFPIQYTYFMVNCILLIIAIKVLGWKFCIKTIYAVLVLTFLLGAAQEFFLWLAHQYPESFPIINPKSGLPKVVATDAFMSVVIGAGIEGVGIGLVFLSNGSTGGTDIVASIVNKYKDVTLGQMMMLLDFIIITSALFLPDGSFQNVIYGFCCLLITNLLLDYVVDRGRQSVQFIIISDHYDRIAEAISRTHRGVTVLNGEGWYTHQERHVLIVLAKRRESTTIFRIIHEADPNAFVSQSKVVGVYGEGFDRMKVKKK